MVANEIAQVHVPRLRPFLGRIWHEWQDRRRLERVLRRVPGLLSHAAGASRDPRPAQWRVLDAEWSGAGAAVVHLGSATGAPAAVLKAAFSPAGRQGLRAQASALAQLESETRFGDWRSLLPRTVSEGESGDLYYTLQEYLPGVSAAAHLAAGGSSSQLLALAAEAIAPLHERSVQGSLPLAAFLERAVEAPISLLRQAVRSELPVDREATLTRLARDLRLAVSETAPRLGWVHGDYWLGNVLVSSDGSRVTGIVDWTMAGNGEPALHDALHLALYGRQLARRVDLGETIVTALEDTVWEPSERAALEVLSPHVLKDPDTQRASVLLYWLRRISHISVQNCGHLGNRVWVAWNIDRILRCL